MTNNDGWGSGGGWPDSGIGKTITKQQWPKEAIALAKAEEKEYLELYGDKINPVALGVKEIASIHTTLKMYNGEVVEAIIVGDLAIWETEEEGWSICHVPTLTDVMSCVPFVEDAVYTNEELIRWCQVAQSSNKEDWLALKSLTRESYQDKPELIEVKQRIRKLCLNTQLNEWRE